MYPDKLLRQIREAFADIPRPSWTMADAEVEDDRNEQSRFDEHDRHWWEIPDELLDRCSAPFAFMPSDTFVYYLPAYMSWFIRTNGGSSSVSAEFLIYFLQDPERGGCVAGLLSEPQASAVCDFLDWVVASEDLSWIHDHARAALHRIWKHGS